MASQEAHSSKFEADFKQLQSEMTNKIDNLLKALNNQVITPSNRVARNTSGASEIKDPSSSKHVHFVNAITLIPPNRDTNGDDEEEVVENRMDPEEETKNNVAEKQEEVAKD